MLLCPLLLRACVREYDTLYIITTSQIKTALSHSTITLTRDPATNTEKKKEKKKSTHTPTHTLHDDSNLNP